MNIPEETVNQLIISRLYPLMTDVVLESRGLNAYGSPGLIHELESNKKFKEGWLHGLHVNVGKHRRDFRSIKGSFGRGSLQVVIDNRTYRMYADIDKDSPYDDVVSFVLHSKDVIRNWFRRI